MGVEQVSREESAFISYLKQIRKSKGITQATLAEQSGLSQQQISMLESGNQVPRLTTIIKYCNAVNVELAVVDKLI